MLNKILNSRTKTITFAAVLLFFSGLLSRFLGLFRDRLLTGYFGAGQELDIYFAAFRIPDFIYGILIMGGVAAVFLPVLSEHFKQDKEKGWELTNNVLNCFLILLVSVCGVLALFTPFLIKFIAPGFSPEAKELAVSLTRIMFLSPILLGLSSIFSGILHYFNRFLAYSLAPILYNLGIIFGILFFLPLFGLIGLAYGVILGAFLHLLIQIPIAVISGYSYRALFNFRFPGLVKIFRLMLPRTIGAAAYHLNLLVITAIASTLSIGSISVFHLSNNLQYFPIGLIGVSFALASFPSLSRSWANKERKRFSEDFSSTFRQVLFFVIPISFLMFLLRAQMVRLIYGTGQFTWLDTRLTAACLGLFCLGIFAFSLIPLLARAFYSFQDTKTPTIIGVISMLVNIILCFLLIWLLGFPNALHNFLKDFLNLQGIKNIQVIGLALALSFAGIIQFFLLFNVLTRKIKEINLKEIYNSLGKNILASVLTGLAVYFALHFIADFVNMQTFFGVLLQTLAAGLVGILVYLFLSFLLKSQELKILKSAISKEFKK